MKHVYKYILTLVAILMVTSNAWAISNAKVTVISEPSVGGTVAINSSNSATDWGTNKSKQQNGGVFDSYKNFTFYRFASAASGYTFKGWSTSQTANSGETNSEFKARGGIAGTESYTYYAIFATLQSSAHNTTVQFNDTKVDEQSSKSITIKHSHAGTVSLSLSGTNAGDFSLNENSFSSTSYQEGRNITIYFKPTCVGERTATLTISSDNGLSSLTINLKGNATRHASSIAWVEPIDVNMFVGGTPRTIDVTASDRDAVTFTSSDPSIISVSGNELTAKAEGTAIITATQAATCKYEASSIKKEFYVHNKKTPTFWLNGDPDQLTDNLKTEETRTITITNVDESMTADYDPNLLSYTFNGSTATIKALDAGTATLKLTQPENNQIFFSERTFTFNITKYDTNTITNNLATEYMVDDIVTEADVYTINNNEVPVEVISSNESVLKFENGQLKAVGAGTATITVKQAETNKWVGISATKENITVKRYDVSATLNPTTTVWNATHSNPFSVSISPANGETITDFIVGESSNSAIATYNASSKTIQTYYTSGSADFQITRPEDRKYNALNQTLTLTVDQNTNGCYLINDPTHYKIGAYENNNGIEFSWDGIANTITFDLWKVTAATQTVYVYGYDTNGTETTLASYSSGNITNDENNPNKCSITVNDKNIVRIKIQAGGTLNKHFKNLKVTRDEYITPSIAQDGMLKLPTVAINQVSTDTFTLNWSTCSNVVIESSNSKFSIGTSQDNANQVFNLLDANGTEDIIVYCNTSEIGIYNGIITIYDQSRSVSFNVTDTVNDKWTPVLTGEESYSKHVGDTWTANFTFKNTETTKPSAETSAPFYFTIDHQSFVNTDRSTRNPEHLDEVISYDPDTYEITAYNAGTAVLTFIQKDTDGYYAGSRSCTITVAKNETNFELNLADLYLVDAEVPTANILKNKSNNEVDIQVSDMTTDNRALFTYNGSVLKANGDQLQADSETTTITVSQPETYKWTGKTLTKDVTVKKYDSQFSFTNEGANYVCKIDDIISESDFYSLATDHEIPATINVEILEKTNEDHPEVLIFNEENRQWEAKSAGKAKVTISQPEDRKWTAYTGTRIVEIQKHTPIFTWNDPVYFNQTISDYFTTNNNPNDSEYATDIVISQESTDPDVAIIYFNPEDETDKHTLDLTTYYKETTPASSTTVTVSQAENWYWYAKEDTHTITPQNRNNQVEFTLTQENYIRDFQVEYVDPAANNKTPMGPDWQDGGIYFGGEGALDGNEGWNWAEKYIIIKFSGIPDTLTFDASRSGAATGTIKLSVSEGTSKDNLTEIWSDSNNSTNNGIECKLNPETRFLKFSYTGNLWGLFKNIHVTELNQFDAVPNSLDFGTVSVTDNTSKSLIFNIAYANAGYKVNIELDREVGRTWADEEAYNLAKQYIEITPEFIGTIGGEKSGTSEAITVRLHSDDQSGYTIPDDARIKIYDEVGHTTYVSLKGLIEKSTQSITWNAYFSLTEPIQIPLSTDWVFKAAEASSNLPVKYKSSDTEVIEVSDDGLSFKPKNEGNAIITAYQEGNSQYGYVESTKNVQVTKKNIQLIGWTDDLSDIIFEENTPDITLNAGVYIIDVVNNTFEYSADQTAKLVYTVGEGGSSVVTVEGNTLHIIGLGETTLTATIEADEFHEGTTMTIPVVVREPAIGCEDILLLDHTAQIEFFQMNTSLITKDAIALDRTKGIPGYLLFQHKGERWASIFYSGSIKAQQSKDGGKSWIDVLGGNITPTVGTFTKTDSLHLDPNATHIRFIRPSGGQGHHFVKDIKVGPAKYLKANTTSIDFESINMGGTYTKTFTLSYSNIKSPLIATTSSKDVTVTPNRLGECGQFGEQEITVTWKPNNNQNQSITIQDTLADLSVTIDLQANIQLRKQKIVWENRPTVIWDYTDIDNRPTHTRDVNNNELIDLPITYEVTEGTDCAYFEDNMFFIINKGSITIKASNSGNEEYLAVDSTYQITIQDIPPTFIGGAENDLWSTDANWVNGAKPKETQTASITAPVTINDEEINVNKVRVASAGSIHITPTGGLTVGEGGVQCVTTDGSAIVIDNLHSGAGFFRIHPAYAGELPRITMRYQTQSTLDNGANKDATWQYIGAPGNNATVYVDYNTWLYKHEEASADWVVEKRMDSVALVPFHGYSITQYGQPTYEWTADFTNQNCTIPLTYSKNGRSGRHIIANSYTAPINVAAFTGDEFTYLEGMSDKYRIEKTLYLYNSGSWNQWHEQDSLGTGTNTDGTNTPGQYYAIPVLAAGENYLDGLQTTITPMQGIYLRVRSKTQLNQLPEAGEQVGNLILNYEQLVMGSDHEMHRPMRAPQRTTSSAMQDPNFRRVRIVATSENSGADRVYIIQDNINTRKYNNGYDAPNQETKGLVNIYTNESGGKMEVSCSNNIDSMYIGFMAGEDQTYTLHFGSIIGNIFYLDDLTTGETINIVEGGTYTFNAEPQSTNDKRFLLRMPRVSSNADALNNAKIWSVDKILYVDNAILPSPLTIYDVSGHHILSDIVDSPQYSIDLSHLLEGVYLVRVNNQVYKFISK